MYLVLDHNILNKQLEKTSIHYIRVLYSENLSNAGKSLKGMYLTHEKEKELSTSTE